jgi:hypothetical protein
MRRQFTLLRVLVVQLGKVIFRLANPGLLRQPADSVNRSNPLRQEYQKQSCQQLCFLGTVLYLF